MMSRSNVVTKKEIIEMNQTPAKVYRCTVCGTRCTLITTGRPDKTMCVVEGKTASWDLMPGRIAESTVKKALAGN